MPGGNMPGGEYAAGVFQGQAGANVAQSAVCPLTASERKGNNFCEEATPFSV